MFIVHRGDSAVFIVPSLFVFYSIQNAFYANLTLLLFYVHCMAANVLSLNHELFFTLLGRTDAGGSTPPRPRRSDQVSVRDPPGETTKTPPAPTPTVNLLDFLTDDPVPVADPTPAAPRPPTLTYQQQQLPQHQHPPWNAFGPDLTSTDAIAPPPQPQLLLTVELAPGPSRGFAPPPAGAGVAQNWATFENSPAAVVVPTQNLPGGFHSGFNVSVANARVDGGGGLSVGDRFEDNCLTAKFANSFSMSGSPRPGKINNPPAPVQPQQQQQQTFFSPSPSLQDSQQSGAPSGYSTPGTPGPPPQQQQQQTEYSSRSRRAQGEVLFECLS